MVSRKNPTELRHGGSKLKPILRQQQYLPKLREAGIVRSGGFVDRETVGALAPALVDLLDDKNGTVRENALDFLIQLGPSAAQPVLLRLIESDDFELRDNAATGLEKLEHCGSELVQPLLAAFQKQDYSVRLRACEALYRLENVDELPISMLFAALATLRDPSDTGVAETMAWLLARSGKDEVFELAERLSHDSFAVRLGAVKALYYLKRVGSELPRVKALVNDEMLPTRTWATIAIADAHTNENELRDSIPALTNVISIPWADYQSAEAKWATVRLLAKAGEAAASAVPAILANWSFGGTAWDLPIEAFGTSAIPHVHAAIESGSIKDHRGLVWLAKLGAPGALELADRIVAKRAYAHYAAVCYGLLGAEGVERARQLLKDPANALFHGYVVQGLRYADKKAIPLIADVLRSGSREGKQSAANVVGAARIGELESELTEAAEDEFEEVRIASACALYRMGRREASVEILRREWNRYADHVLVAIGGTRTSVTELLPLVLARLSEPDNCTSTVVDVIGVLAGAIPQEDRLPIIDTLRAVSGLWDTLRRDAMTTAAKLERPDIDVPFPSILYGA